MFRPTDENTRATEVLVTYMCINILTWEVLLPPLFGDTRVFSVWHVVGFLLFVFPVSWQNYSVAWMASPGRDTASGRTGHTLIPMHLGSSRKQMSFQNLQMTDLSLPHFMPFLPTCQKLIKIITWMYWARSSSWENFLSYHLLHHDICMGLPMGRPSSSPPGVPPITHLPYPKLWWLNTCVRNMTEQVFL